MPSPSDPRTATKTDGGSASSAGSALRTARTGLDGGVQIDDSQRSLGPGARALNRDSSPPEAFSEFQRMLPKPDPSQKQNNIYFDRRDASIGKARYEGATHITKNFAVKPNYIQSGGDLFLHSNVEVELYDKKGKAVGLTERYFRDWAFYPSDPKITIRTFKGWDGCAFPGKREGLIQLPGATKSFLWDAPPRGALTDAPGQQNIYQDKQTYFYLQEFIAGNEASGGFYYQIEYMLDPDATGRIRVRNKIALTVEDFKSAKKIIASKTFASDYENKFLVPKLPCTIDSDTGVLTTIPDIVRKKHEREKKEKAKPNK